MGRTLVVTVALAAALGFAAGWLAFSSTTARPPAAPPEPPHAKGSAAPPDATGVVTTAHRFALRPGDVAAERETPAVAIAADGTIVLAWASQETPGAEVRTLYIARSTDGGTSFDAPVGWRSVPIYRFTSSRSGKERKMAFSTHVLPRLAATRDEVVLGWVEAQGSGPTVQFLVARSRDGGKTFSEPAAVHGGGAARPGFTALAADPDGGLACGWIEGRNGGPQPFFSAGEASSGDFGREQLVFAGPDGKGICPCCDVAVAVAPDAARTVFVAFRNSDSDHRDIWLARAAKGASGEPVFTPPVPVTPDHWTFNGCPHDAPSLAVAGDRLQIAWMDAHTGSGRVYHAVSPVGSLHFQSSPLNPKGRGAQAHPRLAADRTGLVHAVWDEGLAPEASVAAGATSSDGGAQPHHHAAPALGGAGRVIMYAVSRDGGATFSPAHAMMPSPGAYQLHPAITTTPDGTVFVAWNELDQDGKHVVIARLARPEQDKARKPQPAAVSAPSTEEGQAGMLRLGRLAYQVHCARCHGPEGHGDGADAERLQPPPRDFASDHWRFAPAAETVRQVILDGISGTAMPGLGDSLSRRECEGLVAHVLSLAPPLPADLLARFRTIGFVVEPAPRAAPELSVCDLAGRTDSLAGHRGRPVLVLFWGTTCTHCLRDLPAVVRFVESLRAEGIVLDLLPVCIDETSAEPVSEVAGAGPAAPPLYIDRTGTARLHYDVQALPTFVLIDGTGRLVARAEGARDWAAPR
jgi:mono/diheme cytochrome c family protein